MTVIHYSYHRTSKDILRVFAGVIFVTVCCQLSCSLCSVVFCFPLLTKLDLSLVTGTENFLKLLAFLGGFLAFTVVSVLGGYFLYAGLLPYEAALSVDTFTYGRRGRVKVMRLDEIVRVGGDTRFLFRGMTGWVVIVTDKGGQRIELEIGRKANMSFFSNFDYQVILRDLLARLPASVEISPNVRRFVETGVPG